TVAGSGVQRLLDEERARGAEPNAVPVGADPLTVALSSPWDVVWSTRAGRLLVAMAGTHQLFSFDPRSGQLAVLAGTGDEGLKDGPAAEAWFAQSSGLAEDHLGNVWIADSETSALRVLRFDDDGAVAVETAVGEGLFDFGFRDGDAGQARLQHCLGVAQLPDGSVAVADTYNGAVRHYDPRTGQVATLARGLAEPSDVLLDVSGGEPLLVVVEANAHRLVRVPIPAAAQRVDEGASQTQRART
ncbi:hypothetical protein ACFP5Z_18390, partial [Kocuria oceani]